MNMSTRPITNAANSATGMVITMPGTMNAVAYITTADTRKPTIPLAYGDTPRPRIASTSHPSTVMTTAATKAVPNVKLAKPGIREEININTIADTTSLTICPNH